MIEQYQRAKQAQENYIVARRERGATITPDQEYRAAGFLAEMLPLVERFRVSDHGLVYILARATLDAVLAPPRKPTRKERLRQARREREEVNR